VNQCLRWKPELQSLLNDQRIFHAVPPINEPDRHRPLFNPSTPITSETAAPSGANNFTQEYIFPAKEIITLRAFTIQEELNTNPLTKNIYRTKYTEEIIRQSDQSVIIHRLTLQQKNRINSMLIRRSFMRPDTIPYQLSP
jgi:hypothetical protein